MPTARSAVLRSGNERSAQQMSRESMAGVTVSFALITFFFTGAFLMASPDPFPLAEDVASGE